MKSICVVTGTRAEYGLLKSVIDGIKSRSSLSLRLLVTGMHLSPEFGNTVQEIEDDGFHIDKRVEMLLSSDSSIGISKSIGLGLIGISEALNEIKPDLVLVLGDRFEILSAVIASNIASIPVVHISGGEVTSGSIDDCIRHSITKMSHIHLVATEEYRKRVIQLGENPNSVYNVGSLGVDNIKSMTLLSKEELEESINFTLREKNLLITFHPETIDAGVSISNYNEILKCLARLEDIGLIFTLSNADEDGRRINNLTMDFCSSRNNCSVHTSLGQRRYLSCLNLMDAVVGNSSSGIVEAPALGVPTINIGSRQDGRLRARSVLDCDAVESVILDKIKYVLDGKLKIPSDNVCHPYGSYGASKKILHILESIDTINLFKKNFYDLNIKL